MKQENRVQLSFQSILKIFVIFGIGVGFIGVFFSLLIYGLPGKASTSFTEIAVMLVLSPFTFILFAIIGYPFFAMINKIRGGLKLTVYRIRENKEME